MALQDKYVNADIVAGEKAVAAENDGAKTVSIVKTFEINTADDNASVYRWAKNVNPHLIPKQIQILADSALTVTDANMGIWATGIGGTAFDDNALTEAVDLSSGFARGSEANGLTGVAIEDVEKTIYELAGHTTATKKMGYDLALTIIAKGAGGTGTVSIIADFVQGS